MRMHKPLPCTCAPHYTMQQGLPFEEKNYEMYNFGSWFFCQLFILFMSFLEEALLPPQKLENVKMKWNTTLWGKTLLKSEKIFSKYLTSFFGCCRQPNIWFMTLLSLSPSSSSAPSSTGPLLIYLDAERMMDKVEISVWNIWMWRKGSEILNDIAPIALVTWFIALGIRVGPQVEKSSNLRITADSTRSIHKNGSFCLFGGTENGTSGARIEILRPLFNTNTPPKTPI